MLSSGTLTPPPHTHTHMEVIIPADSCELKAPLREARLNPCVTQLWSYWKVSWYKTGTLVRYMNPDPYCTQQGVHAIK